MNPYDILGVPATASLAQIKSAYRRRAMETHPDRGSDGAEFAVVARAYAILNDPEARRRFDETGSVDEISIQTLHQRMVHALASIFQGVMAGVYQSGKRVQQVDWVQQMRVNVDQNLNEAKRAVADQRKVLADATILMKRITRKTDGENLFVDVLKAQIAAIEPALRDNELSVRALERLRDELQHYISEVEIIQAMQTMNYGAGQYGTASTSGSSSLFGWAR